MSFYVFPCVIKLRFDKAITFSPVLKSNLLVSFNTKICDLDVLLLYEFINIASIYVIVLT